MQGDKNKGIRTGTAVAALTVTDEEKRMRWASRRGMLELDLILGPFVSEHYRGLSHEDRLRYRTLMECQDQELFAWFVNRERPADPDLQRIVDTILRSHPGARVHGD